MVRYIEYGNIFEIDEVYNYAHGCNCAGAMGKGIAVQFKEKFPEMYRKYKHLCEEGQFTLGDVFEYNYGKGYVFNLGTQKSWKTKAELSAVEQSLTSMLLFASENKVSEIALPKIGAGLGGLKWDDVKKVIEQVSSLHSGINLFVVENYKV
jgi:O-acetyl-ADP-ribose deacetylase (regulator of RNase III)